MKDWGGGEMSKLPKLKVMGPLRYKEEIYDLEQANNVLFCSSDILTYVLVEGQLIQSAAQDSQRSLFAASYIRTNRRTHKV